MDDQRFDRLTKSLARGVSRRTLLQGLAASLLGGMVAGGGQAGAAPACRNAGHPCEGNQACCDGLICMASGPGAALRCTACPDGQIACANACIAACTASDACHVAGTCDPSSGQCTSPPALTGTACGQSPRCSGGVATGQDTCDGNGTCAIGPTTTCAPYVCGATACLTSCDDDTACVTGYYCAGGQCLPTLANGQPCTATDQCQSGICTDGVCCDAACDGQCEACNLSGSAGTCTAVTGTPVGERPACGGDGTGCGGTCDGNDTQACTYPGTGTSCGQAACIADTFTPAGSCDGQGHCKAGTPQSCAPYACNAAGSACLPRCSDPSECAAGHYCSGGQCLMLEANGIVCDAAGQCASGACHDGYCCDTACTGECMACNVAGHEGTCTFTTGVACGNGGTCQNGTCAGTCLALQQACDDASACCQTEATECNSSQGTFTPTCCRPRDGSCATDQDCCGLISCTSGACCNPSGALCLAHADCCTGVCAGVCICRPMLSPCSKDIECCTGTCCNGTCVRLDISLDNCGACGVAVPSGGVCQNGVPGCTPGFTECAGTCTSLEVDPHNCGSCGNECGTDFAGNQVLCCAGAGVQTCCSHL